MKKNNTVNLLILSAFLIACSANSVFGQSDTSGFFSATEIYHSEWLHHGSGIRQLVSDTAFKNKVVETSIQNTGGTQRSEFVLHKAAPHVDMVYEFHARYMSGTGSLINQWHQPTKDHKGPAASVKISNGYYNFGSFQNGKGITKQLISVDKNWHTWRLEARWSHGSDGYLRLYCDGKLLVSATGNNSKDSAPKTMGASFKVGTYANPKDCTMRYAWARAVKAATPTN